MKVLMSAYACEPNRGSEPGIGWNWAVQAARNHEVWVLTRIEHPGVIEEELKRSPQPNLNVVIHDLPAWTGFLTRSSIGFQFHYFFWQLTAIRVTKRLHRKIGFDLTHHVTWGTIRFLSPLAWLDIPFIWGPVAGGEEAPRRMLTTISRRARVWEVLRIISNRLFKWDPLVRYTAANATAIVAVTHDTVARLRECDRQKAQVLSAMAVEGDITESQSQEAVENVGGEAGERPLQLIFVGRLLEWKGVQLGLEAMAMAISRGVKVTLTIVGDGPARSQFEKLGEAMGLRDLVSFIGNVPRDEALDLLHQSDVMLFPSLHDSGGFAVLEAMQASLPVICLDLGGPAVSVTAESGIKIQVESPEQVIRDLANAIVRMARDADFRIKMGKAGRTRVESEFTWARKGDEIDALYQKVIGTDNG